jgi:glycosyltransferase involved in cell wall biosynthesis
MKTILIFDPAENAGGAFSRAVELAAELPEFHYIFMTYIPFKNLYSGKTPKHFECIRIYSPFNSHNAHKLRATIEKSAVLSAFKIMLYVMINALLKINKIFILTQAKARLLGKKIALVQSNNGIQYLPFKIAQTKKSGLIYYFRDLQYFKHLPQSMINAASSYLFVGYNLRDAYLEQMPLDINKCHIIHSPFDVMQRLQYEPNEDLSQVNALKLQGNKIIICASRICAEKGQETLIEAFALLNSGNPNTKLLIVGEAANNTADQAYLQRLHKLVDTKNIQHSVFFLGFRKDILKLLQLADVAVQAPIYFEALSGSLVEALQLGIPTISSNIGGADEVLLPEQTGFLFEPEDHQALYALLKNILCGNYDLKSIIENGKEHASTKWSANTISIAMNDIYQISIRP